MRTILRYLFLAVVLGGAVPGMAAAQTVATVVWFVKKEPGVDPYAVRYLVTPRYMRSDDGQDNGDFLLYDRRERKIYSVVKEDRRVLEIDGHGRAPHAPAGLSIQIREHVDQKAPKVGGRSPVEVDLMAGGKVCHSALVVSGFLEPVRAALQEYNQALAVQQLRTLDRTPGEYQTPCFLSRYLYATDFHFARGMVLADWNDSGKRRELTRYKTGVPLDDSLFVIPATFQVIHGTGP